MKIQTTLEILAAFVVVIGGIGRFTKWGRYQFKKLWRFLTSYRPIVPKETLRLNNRDSSWSLETYGGKPAMQLTSYWYITNISNIDAFVCSVNLKKPKIRGNISLWHPNQHVYEEYSIPPGCVTNARTDFRIQPPILTENLPLIVDIDFVDKFGNCHRVHKVNFRPTHNEKQAEISVPTETVSDIKDPVEREIVNILQAEIYRYKQCGRRIGGLGSVYLIYQGQSFPGFGTDWIEADSPRLQAIMSDPEKAQILSDNADTLIKFFKTTKKANPTITAHFENCLLGRLSKETVYAPVGYFILFVLCRIGSLKRGLTTAKDKLQGDSAYGFSNLLRLLDGLLKYEHPKFTPEMLDDIEHFLIDIKEFTFRISERLSAIRTLLLKKNIEENTK